MIIPRKLEKGDKVAIVSLSSGVLGEEFVKHEVKLMEERLGGEFGLEYKYMTNARKGVDYLKEHPEARAADLKEAFLDDEVKMIWCAIGGVDGYAMLPDVMNEEFLQIVQAHPKIFMGFSDTTTQHLLLYKMGLASYYGPSLLADVAELGPGMLPYTRDCIKNLFNMNRDIELKSSAVWYKNRESFGPEQVGVMAPEMKETRGMEFLGSQKTVRGKLLGGCIDVMYEMLAWERFPEKQKEVFSKYQVFPEREEWRGKVLFMETSDEQPEPQKFRRMVEKLAEWGVFEEVVGVLVGKPMDEKYLEEYRDVMVEIAEKYDLPVVFNMNFGHGAPRMILPYGQEVVVDMQRKEVKLPFSMVAMPDDEIKKVLREKVDEKRYEHSLLTAEVAKELAEHYGLNAGEAYTAGLVHDAAKRLSAKENRDYVEKYGLDAKLLDEEAKNYIHADVGAVVVKEWFGVSDEIAKAVGYHTIPQVGMTDFDKVVFLADKIGRRDLSEELQGLRKVAFESLDLGMRYFLERQAVDLAKRGIAQREETVEFLRQLPV